MTQAKRILFISPIPTHPQTAGNRTRISALLNALREAGHKVTFLHIQQEQGDQGAMRDSWGDDYISAAYRRPSALFPRIKRKLLGRFSDDMQYAFGIDEWYDPAIDNTLRSLHQRHRYDVVIATYVFFSKALEAFPDNVFKIIDTHDAFANRHRRYLESGERPKWFSTTPRGEARAFDRADLVLAIQEPERAEFSRLTRTPVITIGHMTPLVRLDPERAFPHRMLFVASDNTINVHGIEWFITEVLDNVTEALPDAELVLAGTICNAIPDRRGITKLGRVDDLQSVYESSALVLNPVRFNTGLSIKNLEALGFGKPLVTAPPGADGIEEGIGTAYIVSDDAHDFAQHVIHLLRDPRQARSLGDRGYAFAGELNDLIKKKLAAAIDRS